MDVSVYEALKRLMVEAEEAHWQDGDPLTDDVGLVYSWIDEVAKDYPATK